MISKIIDEHLIRSIEGPMLNCHKFVVISHENPDGDAVGSSLALADFLKCLDKEVTVVLPNAFPANLKWLPGADTIVVYTREPEACLHAIEEAEFIFFLDVSGPDRIGALAPYVRRTDACKVLFDHHADKKPLADLSVVYPQFASTAEIVFRYICRIGRLDLLSKECATCIYTGMMTDTGAFSYNSNESEMYIIIYELMRKGIDKDQIYRNVYNHCSANNLRMKGYVLSKRMMLYPAYQTSIISITARALRRYRSQPGDTDGFVNMPLSIDGILFSIFLREDGSRVRLSFRSIGKFSANRMAKELFGGGGHLNAAGAKFEGTLEEAIQKIMDALPGYYTQEIQNYTRNDEEKR